MDVLRPLRRSAEDLLAIADELQSRFSAAAAVIIWGAPEHDEAPDELVAETQTSGTEVSAEERVELTADNTAFLFSTEGPQQECTLVTAAADANEVVTILA